MHDLQKKYENEIGELVRTTRRLGEVGYVTSHGGNLSFRVSDEHILITPTKVVKRHMTFDDIVIIDIRGETVFAVPGRKPTGETPMHIHLLKQRPDISGLIHAHPPYITGFAMTDSTLLSRPLLPEPIIEVGPVLSVDYAEPISETLARKFDTVVAHSNVWLMENHGVTIGSPEGVGRALDLLEMVEAMAISVHVAKSIGTVTTLTREDVEALEKTIATRNIPRPGDPRVVKSLVSMYFG